MMRTITVRGVGNVSAKPDYIGIYFILHGNLLSENRRG